MYPLDDTIAAIASPPGGAARGIVRLSGPQAIECVGRLLSARTTEQPLAVAADSRAQSWPARSVCRNFTRRFPATSTCGAGVPPARMQARRLHHKCEATPASRWPRFTPSARRRLLQLLLRSLCAAGARLAGPGEFTLRAFLAGRIDLDAGRGRAGSDRRRRSAGAERRPGPIGRRAGPAFAPPARYVCSICWPTSKRASISPTKTCPSSRARSWSAGLPRPSSTWRRFLRQMASRGEPAHAVKAVLVGRPNTGKSSLFNALAGDRAALVSDLPGTTRDYLIAELDLDGVKCQLIDTAGTSGEGREERGEGRGRARRYDALDCGPGGQLSNCAAQNPSPPSSAARPTWKCSASIPPGRWTTGNASELQSRRREEPHRRAHQVRCAARDRLRLRRRGDEQH